MAQFDTLKDKLGILLARARYRTRMIRLAFRVHPIAGGSGEEEGDEAGAAEDSAAESGDDSSGDAAAEDDASEDQEDAAGAQEPDWKKQSRRHERDAKKARAEAERLRKELDAREDKDKSEQDRAIEEAASKARTELQSEHEKERRADRLEMAITKIAAKGLKIGSGDDEKTVRFADPDDALRLGDFDEEDIFDENGKVRSDQLEEALADLLERKPHLASETKAPRVKGSADAGKGSPASTENTVESQLKKVRRHSPERATEGAKFRRAA